jgi:uncharacterized protein YkwD
MPVHAATSAAEIRARFDAIRNSYRPATSVIARAPSNPPTTQPSASNTTVSDETFALSLAKRIHELTNTERTRAGLTPLAWDERLATIADAHSEDMAANNFFAHSNRSGCNSPCRLQKAGYTYWYMGENIAWISGRPKTDALAAQFISGWMNSPGHKANVLSKNFSSEGVGIAIVGSKVYATANFAHPR